jgi:hypothetical protein
MHDASTAKTRRQASRVRPARSIPGTWHEDSFRLAFGRSHPGAMSAGRERCGLLRGNARNESRPGEGRVVRTVLSRKVQ